MSKIASFADLRKGRTAGEWLEEQVRLSKNGVITLSVDLTPDLARALLHRNPANRKVSGVMVGKFARDMQNGAWAFNGEPIIVSVDGLLNDGQHRCEAVIASDATVPVVLVVGTGRDTRLTIDQGKNRLAGDYLAMSGHVDSVALAAAAGYVWQFREHGQLSAQTRYKATKSEVLSLVEAEPNIAVSLSSVNPKGSDAVGGRSMIAFCHFVMSEKAGKEAASEFVSMLTEGANLAMNSPVLYARNRLMASRGRLRPNERAEMVIRAWNAHRRRETPKTLPILDNAPPTLER